MAWGDARYGADTSSMAARLESGTVVQVYATGAAFAAVHAPDGSVTCWGDALLGGDCSDSDVAQALARGGVVTIASTWCAHLGACVRA